DGRHRLPLRGQLVALDRPEDPPADGPVHAGPPRHVNASVRFPVGHPSSGVSPLVSWRPTGRYTEQVPRMSFVLLVLLSAWLVIVAFALLLCAAARRTDSEISGDDLAPVIDIRSVLTRKHVA